MQYFSDRELGEVPQTVTDISPAVWDGIAALIQGRIADASFGLSFPDLCPESQICCGVDSLLFHARLKAEVPEISERVPPDSRWGITHIETPPLVVAMDVIEFCWKSVSKARQFYYHSFLRHHHLDFDKEAGQSKFREDVNLIFRRNGLAFSLTEQGRVERSVPGEIGNALRNSAFQAKDATLNDMLETARRKFLSPDEKERREALEKLWDAWERIKTIDGPDKRVGATAMLDRAAGSSSPKFRSFLESEANALTRAGNKHGIRHSETDQEGLASIEHVDYLFYRMFSLLNLILSTMDS